MIDRYENIVIRTICRILVPFVQLYGLYVIMHGHYTPGGGFQGGVILGASFILLMLAYGADAIRRRMSLKGLTVLGSLGVLIYSGIGLVCILRGGNYLDYGKLPLPLASIPEIRAMGILGIEIGVGISVMAIMAIIFLVIASYDTAGEKNG